MRIKLFAFILSLSLLPLSSQGDVDSAYPAGDVFFLQALHRPDEVMRLEDYKNFYPILKNLSQLKFRVIMDWSADYKSLERALKNNRPSIIIWSSHGDEEGFHQEIDHGDGAITRINEIPFSAFKNISKSVYQVVIATCKGQQALKHYDLSGTDHVQFSYFNESISTDMFKTFLSTWNPLENHPLLKVKNKITCTDKQMLRDGKVISEGYESQNECIKYMMSDRDGFMCIKDKNSILNLAMFDTKNNLLIKDAMFNSDEDCLQRPSLSKNSKICVMGKNNMIQIYDTRFPGVQTPFLRSDRLLDCYNSILN